MYSFPQMRAACTAGAGTDKDNLVTGTYFHETHPVWCPFLMRENSK